MSPIRLGTGRHKVIRWSGLRIRSAAGAWLEDDRGDRYLDFFGASGVNLIGHGNRHVVDSVGLAFGSRGIGAFPGSFEDELVAELDDFMEDGDWDVELFSGGAEAVEAALRAAEEYTGRPGVVGFTGGFHGKTMGARSVTDGASPPVRGTSSAPYPDCARCPLGLNPRRCGFACVDRVAEVVAQAPDPVGAIIVEPLQGRSGNILPPNGYLSMIRRLADDLGLLLIMDETLTCLGRTGFRLAHHADAVRADLVVIGKGLGGGYPVSALLGRPDVMHAGSFGVPSGSSSSFGGYAAAAAAAAAVLRVVRDEGLVERSRQLGEVLRSALGNGLADCPAVERVSGRGLSVGVHFTEPAGGLPRRFFEQCLQRGLLTMTGDGSARLYPPLNIDEDDLLHGAEIIELAAWSVATGTTPC